MSEINRYTVTVEMEAQFNRSLNIYAPDEESAELAAHQLLFDSASEEYLLTIKKSRVELYQEPSYEIGVKVKNSL